MPKDPYQEMLQAARSERIRGSDKNELAANAITQMTAIMIQSGRISVKDHERKVLLILKAVEEAYS